MTLVLAGAFVLPAQAIPTSYSGSLSVADGGLLATLEWDNPATTLSWVVNNTTTPGMWHYEYTFTVPSKNISHILIEVSDADPGPAFTLADLFSPWNSDWTTAQTVYLQTWTDQQGNQGLPAPIYALKFNTGTGSTAWTVTFDSDRVPTWGDFWSKDGGGDTPPMAYNAGFLAPDPTVPPHDGSELDHLLVPDTRTERVPAPSAILLGAVSTGLVAWLRRRRTL